jgi:hypothetical protein
VEKLLENTQSTLNFKVEIILELLETEYIPFLTFFKLIILRILCQAYDRRGDLGRCFVGK